MLTFLSKLRRIGTYLRTASSSLSKKARWLLLRFYDHRCKDVLSLAEIFYETLDTLKNLNSWNDRVRTEGEVTYWVDKTWYFLVEFHDHQFELLDNEEAAALEKHVKRFITNVVKKIKGLSIFEG